MARVVGRASGIVAVGHRSPREPSLASSTNRRTLGMGDRKVARLSMRHPLYLVIAVGLAIGFPVGWLTAKKYFHPELLFGRTLTETDIRRRKRTTRVVLVIIWALSLGTGIWAAL